MFETGKRPHITVVGDLILDRYLIGDATKLNPEQPGVVIRVDKEEDRLGGAAAVAMIAAGLGARVTLVGVVGRDDAGERLRRLIDAYDIEPHLWIDDRPTTWKQRIVARGQLRPDRCDREVTTAIARCAEQFISAAPLGDMLLFPDYGKGVCTVGVLQSLSSRAHAAGVPILVDPARSRSWSDYGGVTLIKANQAEAIEASGTENECPFAIANWLSVEHQCHVVMTIGPKGLVCAEHQGHAWRVSATVVEAKDVCGAGDTVLATLGVALSTGCTLREATIHASDAAAGQVQMLGVAPVLPTVNGFQQTCGAGKLQRLGKPRQAIVFRGKEW